MASLLEEATDLVRHPYARRFITRIYASGDNRVRTAEDVLGERRMRVAGFLITEDQKPGFAILPRPMRGGTAAGLKTFASIALGSVPYLWTEEVRSAIRDLKLPRHVLSPRLLPQPRTWHTFFTGIQLGGELKYEGSTFEGHSADAMCVFDEGLGFSVSILGEMRCVETGEQHPAITSANFLYGSVYPDDFEGDSDLLNVVTGPLLMFAFLNSPHIPKQRQRPSRAARREATRAGIPIDDDEHVTFVVLRRPSARHKSGEENSVEWRHQWLVNGHLRAQWYPTEQAHRVIWIAPHLKGPPDAPMLEHAYKVAR